MNAFELFDEIADSVSLQQSMEVDKFGLIEEIRKRPLLWDFRHFYESRNNKKIDELWQEIGKILGTEVTTCKLVWQKLRTSFFNELKRIPMRVAKAKRKGRYDPSKKYTACPYFDAIKFVAHGRSIRGVSDPSLQAYCKTKYMDNQSSKPKVKNCQSNCVPIESDNSSHNVVETDSRPKSKSHCESVCKNQKYQSENASFSNDEDINLIQRNKFPTVSNPKAIMVQTECKTNNQKQSDSECKPTSSYNCHLEPEEPASACTVILKTELEYISEIDNDDFAFNRYTSSIHENKHPAVTTTTPDLSLDNRNFASNVDLNECERYTQSYPVLLEEDIAGSVDSCDPDYKFLYNLVSRMKEMSHLQKLEFRAKMSSLMLDIFSSSAPVKYLDKRVLLGRDNDPDKKFLISFLPFLKSLPLSQNLQFRDKVADLVLNILL